MKEHSGAGTTRIVVLVRISEYALQVVNYLAIQTAQPGCSNQTQYQSNSEKFCTERTPRSIILKETVNHEQPQTSSCGHSGEQFMHWKVISIKSG